MTESGLHWHTISNIFTSFTLSPPLPFTLFLEYSLKLYNYHQVILSLKTFTAFLFHQQIHTLHPQLIFFHKIVLITLTVFCKYSPSPQPFTINSNYPAWSLFQMQLALLYGRAFNIHIK